MSEQDLPAMDPATESPRGVVVGVDGSAPSAIAALWAARRAAADGTPLHLVHAYLWPTPVPAMPLGTTVGRGVPEAYAEAGDAVLTAAADAVRAEVGTVAVTTELRIGGAAHALVEASRGADLVVTGTRGLGGFTGLLLGSVSTQVAAHAHCPAVVVRGDGEHPERPVVVGVDGSHASDAALRFAFAEAARHGLPLIAVHAWGAPPPPGLGEAAALALAGGEDRAGFEESARRVLHDALRPWRERFPGVDVAERPVEAGPAPALLDAAKSASLVVVGSRGHGGFTGLLLGSTSQSVLHHAACPVVVARPEDAP